MATSRLCSIPGCDKRARGRGWCGKHYQRWASNGDPLRLVRPSNDGPCSIPGCDRPRHGYGLCYKHWARLRKHGNPVETKNPNLGKAKRFISETVLPFRGDDCLIWPFARKETGYAVARIDGKSTRVHRYACEIIHGERPSPRHEVAHSCGNGHIGCVNPHHLRWATHRDNLAERMR